MSGTVWILGAGFSRSLGAPLLNELFSLSALERLRAAFPDYQMLQTKEINAAHWLYHWGTDFREGPCRPPSGIDRVPGRRLWRDPEEYLDALESELLLQQRPPDDRSLRRSTFLHSTLNPDAGRAEFTLSKVRDAAKRLMAAECCLFMQVAAKEGERWDPYVRWARKVGSTDTVLTFNYDTVLDELVHRRGNLEIVMPFEVPQGDGAPVLKLHGSVNWERRSVTGGVQYDPAGQFAALNLGDKALAIASPGPEKLKLSKEMDDLWKRAEYALSQASCIAFLGYRFPPTDSEARRRLLSAIGKNANRVIRIVTVLGPDMGDPDVVRLRKLLEFATPSRGKDLRTSDAQHCLIESLPLYAEDFLSLYEPALLNPPSGRIQEAEHT